MQQNESSATGLPGYSSQFTLNRPEWTSTSNQL